MIAYKSSEDRTQTIYAEQENCFVETQLICCQIFFPDEDHYYKLFSQQKIGFQIEKKTFKGDSVNYTRFLA